MESLRQDLRSGLRVLSRSPGFALLAVMILALSIGVNTAIFGILHALLLRELPVHRPDRLVALAGIYRNDARVPFSFPMFERLERGQRVFSGLFGWSGIAEFNVETGGALFRAGARGVTGNYFSELGAQPLLGRLLAPADDEGAHGSPVAVIGYEFWERRFARDPAVLGKTFRLEDRLFTIVGVTRKWFTGISVGEAPDITVPLTAMGFDVESHSALWVFAGARLREGVPIEQARAQLESFWPEALNATLPTQSSGERLRSYLAMRLAVESAATGVNPGLRSALTRPLYLLLGAGGLILLIACVNFANLTLARAAARGYEMTVRLALGAPRRRIIRHLLTESVLLSAIGAALGWALVLGASPLLVRLIAGDVVVDLRPDWSVFLFAAAAAVLSGLLTGLAPAWQLSRQQPAAVLRRSERNLGRATPRLGKALIVAQIALSLVLLHGAALFLGTLRSLRAFDTGFDKQELLQVHLSATPNGYEDVDMSAYRRQLIQRIAALPGVVSAATSSLSLLAGERGWRDTVALLGDSASHIELPATLAVVSPEFFQTLGVPLVSGRGFFWTEGEQHPPVAILGSSLAERLSASGAAVGERIRFGVQPFFQNLEVVGVANSARLVDPRSDAPVLFVSALQYPNFSRGGTLLVRTSGPGGVTRELESEIRALGREYSTRAATVAQTSEQALRPERAIATLSGLFAAAALLLAGIGLFGLTSYAITRRSSEIGIRLALGSQPGGILRMILRETLLLAAAGIALGVPCALAATNLVGHMLFGLEPHDPVALAAVTCVLLVVAALAGYFPARRATRIDPLAALKQE